MQISKLVVIKESSGQQARWSFRNLNRTQNKYADFESDSDEAKLAALEDSGSDFEDTLKKQKKSYVFNHHQKILN